MSTKCLPQSCPFNNLIRKRKDNNDKLAVPTLSVIKKDPLEWPLEMKSLKVIHFVLETHPRLHTGGHQLWVSLRMTVNNTELGGNQHGYSTATGRILTILGQEASR